MTDLLPALAAWGTGAELASRFPTTPLDDADWGELSATATAERLDGLLLAAVRSGDLPATRSQHDEARARHEGMCRLVLRLDRQLLRVAPVLAAAGVDALVLKGPAHAVLDYPDAALRGYGDIDVLLRSEQFDDGMRVLRDVGYDRPWRQMRPGFDARFGKGATLRGRDGLELDVHRTFTFGAFGLAVDLDDLFEDTETFDVGGQRLRALGAAPRFLHACYHAALGRSRPRYTTLRDVVQLAPADVDVARRAIELARRWQGEVVVARAVRLVEEHLGVRLQGAVAAAFRDHEPSPREVRALRSQVGPERSFASQVVAALPYLPTTRERAAFLLAAALPSSDSRANRGVANQSAWVRRGLASLRAAARR